MKSRLVATVSLLALGILVWAFVISSPSHHEPVGAAPAASPAARPENPISHKNEASPSAPPTAAQDKATNAVSPVVPDMDHEEYVRERVAELTTLAMNDDANSLRAIWSELSNPDKEIRAGALEAVVQFGDRSVVPSLRALAAKTEDSAEKASIIAAADQLELPPLFELEGASPANSPPQPSH
jgi:hypothetical protein